MAVLHRFSRAAPEKPYLILRSIFSIGISAMSILVRVTTADLFDGADRGRAMMIGSVVCWMATYISMIGSSFLLTSGLPWKTTVYVAPFVTVPSIIAFYCLMPRTTTTKRLHRSKLRVLTELKDLLQIKSAMLLILGHAFGDMCGKAAWFWLPTIRLYGHSWKTSDFFYGLDYPTITTIFTVLNIVGELSGMTLNLWLYESWQDGRNIFTGHANQRALPIVASTQYLITAPLQIASLALFTVNFPASLALYFIQALLGGGYLALLANSALNATPHRLRAASVALHFLALGVLDSPSSFMVGALSDAFRAERTDDKSHFFSLLWANAFLLIFVVVAAGILIAMLFLPKRRRES